MPCRSPLLLVDQPDSVRAYDANGMAVTAQTSERLWWHAGFPADQQGTSVDELLFEREPTPGEFEVAMDDLLQTFETLNRELNGAIPSETTSDDKERDVPIRVAYAVSEITDRLRRKARPDEAEIVARAWNAVLAGDIDDIGSHIRLERSARGD